MKDEGGAREVADKLTRKQGVVSCQHVLRMVLKGGSTMEEGWRDELSVCLLVGWLVYHWPVLVVQESWELSCPTSHWMPPSNY
jgi:hypothetical protein